MRLNCVNLPLLGLELGCIISTRVKSGIHLWFLWDTEDASPQSQTLACHIFNFIESTPLPLPLLVAPRLLRSRLENTKGPRVSRQIGFLSVRVQAEQQTGNRGWQGDRAVEEMTGPGRKKQILALLYFLLEHRCTINDFFSNCSGQASGLWNLVGFHWDRCLIDVFFSYWQMCVYVYYNTLPFHLFI